MNKKNSSKKSSISLNMHLRQTYLKSESPISKGLFIKKVLYKEQYEDGTQNIETLQSAWNNLPGDCSIQERLIFLEIAEKIVKIHQKLKKLSDLLELEEKN